MSLSSTKTCIRIWTSTLGVGPIVVIAVLIPIPASAFPIPVTPHEITPASQPPNPDVYHMSPKVIFDMVFALGLFISAISAFVCIFSSETFAEFNAVIDWLCAASDAVRRHLSPFHLATFFGQASDAIAGTENASVPSTRNEGGGIGSDPTISGPSILMGRLPHDSDS